MAVLLAVITALIVEGWREHRATTILSSGDGQAQIRELQHWDSMDEMMLIYGTEVGWDLKLGTDSDAVIDYLAKRGALTHDVAMQSQLVLSPVEIGSDHSLQVLRAHKITICDSPFLVSMWPKGGITATAAAISVPWDNHGSKQFPISTRISAEERRVLNAEHARCPNN